MHQKNFNIDRGVSVSIEFALEEEFFWCISHHVHQLKIHICIMYKRDVTEKFHGTCELCLKDGANLCSTKLHAQKC